MACTSPQMRAISRHNCRALASITSILPLCDPELLGRPVLAFPAAEPITQAPDLGVILDAMLSEELVRRNLDFATTVAAHLTTSRRPRSSNVGSVRSMKLRLWSRSPDCALP